MTSRKPSAALNSVSSVVALALTLGISLWLEQYLLHRIAPEEYALWPVALAVMALPPLLHAALSGGLNRFLGEAHHRNDREQISCVISSLLGPLWIAAAVGAALGALLVWQLPSIFSVDERYHLDSQIVVGALWFAFIIQFPLAPYQASLIVTERFLLSNCIQLSGQFMQRCLY